MSSSIRLEASSFSVEHLLGRVRAGEVRVPSFQRRFKWTRSDVEKLVDSIHRSYPIGTLLLWKRPGPAERLVLGDLAFDVASSDSVLWVVDGQQRLTSLANVLLTDSPGARFDVAFDPLTSSLTRARKDSLPLSVAVDSERLLDWLSERSLASQGRRAAIHLGAALREYRVPAWIVETTREEDIREIFGRLNSLGTKLKPHEIFEALERTPATSLSATAQRVSSLGFGAVSNKLIHQTVRAFQGEDFTKDRVGRVKDPTVFEDVEQGLSNAIVLIREAGIPHLKLLPYNFALVILGAFFARHRTPSTRNRELLQRWLWRGAISGQQSGGDLAWLRANINALGYSDDEAVQAMLRATRREVPTEWDVTEKRFDLRSARSRIEALALLSFVEPPLAGETVARALETGRLVVREIVPARKVFAEIRSSGRAVEPRNGFVSVGNQTVVIDGKTIETPALEPGPAPEVSDSFQPLARVVMRNRLLSERIPLFLEARARTLEDDREPLDSLKLEDEVIDAA